MDINVSNDDGVRVVVFCLLFFQKLHFSVKVSEMKKSKIMSFNVKTEDQDKSRKNNKFRTSGPGRFFSLSLN